MTEYRDPEAARPAEILAKEGMEAMRNGGLVPKGWPLFSGWWNGSVFYPPMIVHGTRCGSTRPIPEKAMLICDQCGKPTDDHRNLPEYIIAVADAVGPSPNPLWQERIHLHRECLMAFLDRALTLVGKPTPNP